MIEAKKLTAEGIKKFEQFLIDLKEDSTLKKVNLQDLEDFENFAQFQIDETKKFESKYEFAEYIFKIFEDNKVNRNQILQEFNFWNWLSYLYFDILCPIKKGQRNVKEKSKYIRTFHYSDYYRHLISSPYAIYSIHYSNSKLLLYSPLHEHNDWIEQLASKQFLISSPSLIETAYKLYWDEEKKSPKKSASNRSHAGNVRRLKVILSQLELTYDIYSMNAQNIIGLLPKEFDSWKTIR